jgi:hypothetical protein
MEALGWNPHYGGYRFVDAGDGQGVWTPEMRDAERTRRNAAQAASAAQAEAAMQTQIDAILNNGALSNAQKYAQLSRLVASGYSRKEFQMIDDAKGGDRP